MQLLGLHWSSTHRHAPGSFIYNIRSGGSDRKELCCDLTLSLPSWGVLMNTGCKFSTKIPIPWIMNIQEVLPVSTNSFSSAFHSVERTCYNQGSTAKLQTQEQLCKEPMCLLKMRGCGERTDGLGVPVMQHTACTHAVHIPPGLSLCMHKQPQGEERTTVDHTDKGTISLLQWCTIFTSE